MTEKFKKVLSLSNSSCCTNDFLTDVRVCFSILVMNLAFFFSPSLHPLIMLLLHVKVWLVSDFENLVGESH